MGNTYDFIIVGAGPSGSTLASRLSRTPSSPSVLLLEAGGENSNAAYLVPGDRFSLAFTEPDLNWGYKTAPQKHLIGQEIDYSRGRGLGGSTAINFSCWVRGGEGDYDEWARKVGDDTWKWENVKERFKKIENYHVSIRDEHKKYVNPKPEDHGTTGPLDLSYADPWERGLSDVFIAAEQTGLGLNPDINSGNPLGMGMGASCMYDGKRTTASAYLSNPPSNLVIKVNSPIAKILFDGKKAVGVKTVEGEEYRISDGKEGGGKGGEVILSAGALNTPQILMLSGVGPQKELEKFGIEKVVGVEGVGRNMQDHAFSTATIILREGWSERGEWEGDEEGKRKAREEYKKTGKAGGKLGSVYCGVPMGWFKNDAVLASKEFQELPKDVQEYINQPTVPIFEIATHTPPLFLGHPPNTYTLLPTDSYLTCLSFIMNPQSVGSVTLSSTNPSHAPIIDPNFVSHPYDRRVLIEGMRSMMKFLKADVWGKGNKFVGSPEGDDEESVWEHCKGNLMSSWHMCRTARMKENGEGEEADWVVDGELRVRGTEGLRVCDLSVLPLLPNNHTQSTAYLVGETAAEKIIQEYGLDQRVERQGKL